MEKVKLLRLTLFSFLVGNEDMHLKNFSIIRNENVISLTPAYDLLNTTLVLPQPEEELAFRAIGAIIFLKSHDNVYFQYQEGFLSEEAWAALQAQLKAGLDDPDTWVRGIYEENPQVWRESFRELIEELIAD